MSHGDGLPGVVAGGLTRLQGVPAAGERLGRLAQDYED
jgi:hypothetical protein